MASVVRSSSCNNKLTTNINSTTTDKDQCSAAEVNLTRIGKQQGRTSNTIALVLKGLPSALASKTVTSTKRRAITASKSMNKRRMNMAKS